MNKPGAKPFASIIVPTYNQGQYVGAALDSIQAQTDASWEAIVVNDGSTDDTAAIVDAYARADNRFKVVHKQNGGVASALNEGLRHATGDWVHWLSSDDMFEPDKLAINREWIRRNPDCNFYFSYFTLLRESTKVLEKRELWGPIPEPDHQILTLLYRNYVSGIAICVKRVEWESVGFFDEDLYYAQDYDQWLRLLAKNKGTFIPEWTVINRNHALQGSEVFPDACYFDTAKAAIRFLNGHSFPELVPFSDLTERTVATAAVEKALDVASDPSAFIYCLGPQPALVLRVLEWIHSGEIADPALAHDLHALVRGRIKEEAMHPGSDAWRWMWQELAAACANPRTRFAYDPVDTRALGTHLHAVRRQAGDPSAEPLRGYLRRFEGIEEEAEAPPGGGSSRIVLLLPHRSSGRLRSAAGLAAEKLARLGHHPVLVDGTDQNFRFDGNVTRVPRHETDHEGLVWFDSVDLAVTFGEEAPVWLEALSTLRLDREPGAASIAARVTEFQTDRGNALAPRPVAFLQRVLWGGGAERVVHEIVSRLDRTRYRPFVLTLFECEDDCTYPPDVPIICVRNPKWTATAQSSSSQAQSAPPTEQDTGSEAERVPDRASEVQAAVISSALVPFSQRQERFQLAHLYRRFKPTVRRFVQARQRLRDRKRVLESSLFDPEWYMVHYPDVASSGTDPLDHYLEHGGFEGRSAGPEFSASEYLACNPDVAKAGVHPLLHYLTSGKEEGRRRFRNRAAEPGDVSALPSPALPEAPAPVDSEWRHSAFMQALAEHWPAGDGLRQVLSAVGPGTALVSVMEEGTVASWLAQIGGGLRFVASLHIPEATYLPQMYPDASRLAVEHWALANACRAAERVIFPSAGCRDDLVANFDVLGSKVGVIGNPVNCARIRRLSLQDTTDEGLIPEGRFVYVHLGRLDPQKNHELLIEACEKLAAVRDDFSVLCIGAGTEEARLLRMVESRGLGDRIVFTGERRNPFPLVRRAGALVLTSKYESFALVLLEAMVCGVPVISVDCPFGPREVLQDGASGLLVPPDDPSALANAMAALAEMPELRDELIGNGYKRAADFDVSRVVRQWEELIDSALPRTDSVPEPSAFRRAHTKHDLEPAHFDGIRESLSGS